MTIAELERSGQAIADPVWPLDDKQAWIMDCIQLEAVNINQDLLIEEDRKEKLAFAKHREETKKAAEVLKIEARAKQLEALKARALELKRDRVQPVMGIIDMGKVSQTGGITMARKSGDTKTGLIDSLLKADMGAAYEDNGVANIVAQTLERFPNEDEKKLRGLVFSRRAVIKKALEAQAAQPVEA